MISDLRYVDPSSASGQMETRVILKNIGTPESVIDWVLEVARDHREETRGLEKELAQVHLDMVE